MVNINYLKRITVKINDSGSGVIVKPCTDEYCYVFTDWHVIEGIALDKVSVEYYVLEKDEDGEDVWSFKEEYPIDIFKKENKDVAILVMPASMAHEFVKLRILEDGRNLYHVGFPENLKNAECDSQWNYYNIDELNEKLNYGFIAYKYKTLQSYQDLSGTSGGGVFTEDGCLIGLHQGSSIKTQDDYYSKCNIIPIKFFKNLIEQKKLEPVWFCKWNSFQPFLEKAFYINNGELFMKMMSTLAIKLDEIKRECQHLSPKDIKDKLDLEKVINDKCFQNCFENESFGISFLEYIVCMHIMYNIPLSIDGVCNMAKQSPFIYWENSDDGILEVIKKIDSSYIGDVKLGENIYVGGLKSDSYELDMIKKDDKTILDISKPLLTENSGGIDIFSPNKLEFNYINTCLFKDCIVHKIKEFNGLNSEDAINKYKDILLNKIS